MGPRIGEEVKSRLLDLIYAHRGILEGGFKGDIGNVSTNASHSHPSYRCYSPCPHSPCHHASCRLIPFVFLLIVFHVFFQLPVFLFLLVGLILTVLPIVVLLLVVLIIDVFLLVTFLSSSS